MIIHHTLKAMKGKHPEAWLDEMTQEFTSLQSHNVGSLVEPPHGANISPGMWWLKIKRDESQKVTTYKARWVADFNNQIQGIDFDST